MGTNVAPSEQNADDDGFKTSLAALRNILMLNSPAKAMLQEPLIADVEGARLKKELKIVKENLQSQEQKASLLEKKSEEFNQEAQRERSLRETLEITYAALACHKSELTAQGSTLINQRKQLEEKVASLDTSLQAQTEKYAQTTTELDLKLNYAMQEKEKSHKVLGETEAKLLASEQKVKEIDKEMRDNTRNSVTEREKLVGLCGSLERSIEALRARLVSSDVSMTKLNTDLEIANTEIHAKNVALEESNAKLTQAKELSATLAAAVETTKTQLQEVAIDNQSSEQARKEQQEEIEKLKSEAAANQELMEKMKADQEALVSAQKLEIEEAAKKSTQKTIDFEQQIEKKEKEVNGVKSNADEKEKELQLMLDTKESLLKKREELVTLLKSKAVHTEKALHEKDTEISVIRQESETHRTKRKEEVEAEWLIKLKSVNEELLETKDELQCAEEEVARCRAIIIKLEMDTTQGNVDKMPIGIEVETEKMAKDLKESIAATKTTCNALLEEEQRKSIESTKENQNSVDGLKESLVQSQTAVEVQRVKADQTTAKDQIEGKMLAMEQQKEDLQSSTELATDTSRKDTEDVVQEIPVALELSPERKENSGQDASALDTASKDKGDALLESTAAMESIAAAATAAVAQTDEGVEALASKKRKPHDSEPELGANSAEDMSSLKAKLLGKKKTKT